MSKNALIIFAKNSTKSNVKTRLAVHLGDDATLSFYKLLLVKCKINTISVEADKYVFYDKFIDEEDIFTNDLYQKKMQSKDENLGIKMKKAIHQILDKGYSKCIIIGSDCPYLNANIINKSFHKLDENDAIIGPAMDGGFYLFGVKDKNSTHFNKIKWSSNKVTTQLSKNLIYYKLKVEFLQPLEDIDEIESYNRYMTYTMANR